MKWTWVKWCLLGIAVLCVCLVWLHTPGDHWNNTPNPQNQSEKPQQIKLHSGQFVNRVNRNQVSSVQTNGAQVRREVQHRERDAQL